MTDLIHRTKTALRTILDTAPAVTAVTGRQRGNCRAWKTRARDVALPVILYAFASEGTSPSSEHGSRRLTFLITCVAEGRDAEEVADALAAAVETSLIFPSFAAHDLRATVVDTRRADVDDDDQARDIERADIHLDLWVAP